MRENGKKKGSGAKPNFISTIKIHKDMLRRYNSEICKARRSFFSNTVNRDMNNARVFSCGKVNKSPSQLCPELATISKCNEFANF